MERALYEDEDVLESETIEQEYFVMPRPQELIYSHLQSSGAGGSKSSLFKGKEPPLTRRLMKPNPIEKMSLREKYLKLKEAQKSMIKGKSVFGGTMSSKGSKQSVSSQELETKHDSYLQGAKKNVKKFQSNPEPTSKFTSDNSEKSSYRSTPPMTNEFSRDEARKQMRERATSAQDRYDILNKRDSYLRLEEAKRVEPKRKVIKGTCPDMCPEKERYSRIAKNCLSVFETKMGLDPMSNSKEVDHRFMVKEYSRSSADQQEPLPNELRPVSVLNFTMDYLICNIINQQNDHISVADWYDFIWNRTRSIRKDITQQQLGDIQCVDILEKCARFHILCAELLSEEDTATFDPKINNENLTKCLQTLKHMYYDLETKGIQCPNEAEFRAYDILLSLTEGETLRLVKDLRKEVFKSAHVTTAFEAAIAFKSNNYVKFFNLMEKASYLSSCIMHRYMHEARVRAMQVIIRSYTVQNKPTLYPLSNLVRKLKFENIVEAAQFCVSHGLTVSETDVTLQKQAFKQQPSSHYPVERSSILVGKKAESGLGVIVNNGPLPENPLSRYQPVNSFDENGVLMDSSYADAEADEDEDEEEEEEDDMSQEEESDTEIIDPPSLPSIGTLKEHEYSLHSSVSAFKKSDIFEEKVPATFQPVVFPPKSTFYPSDTLKKEDAFKKQSSFAFKAQTENFITQSNTLSSPKIPSVSKFFANDSPSTIKCSIGMPIPPVFEETQSESTSSVQTTTAFPSVTKTPSASAVLKSFKWPDAVLEAKSAFFTQPVLSTIALERSEENEMDTMSTQNVDDDSNSFIKSDVKENIFDIDDDDMMTQSETMIERISPDIDLADSDYADILLLKDKEDTIDEYDKEDEETLRKIRDEKISELVLNIADEVYSQCIEKLSTAICKETVAEEWNKKIERDNHAERMRVYLSRKVLYKWRLFCERKKHRNMYTHSEPLSPWIPMLINTEYVTSGASSPFTAYKKHCSLSRLADAKIKERAMKPGWEPLVAENFISLFKQPCLPSAYLKETGIDKFFKIGLVFLRFEDRNIDLFIEWMSKKLNLFPVSDIQTKRTKEMSFFSLKKGKTVICFSAVTLESYKNSNFDDLMKGISALILCCPTNFPDSKAFRSILDQLTGVFKHSNLLSPFPLFTFLLPSGQKFSCEKTVVNELASFLNDNLYSGCNISTVKMSPLSEISNCEKNSNDVVSAVKWLIESQELAPELLLCRIQNFVEDSFISAFNAIFWKLSLPEFKLLYQVPQHSINFYNKMLKCRASLLNSPLLMKAVECWPPQELLVLHPDYNFIDTSFQKEFRDLISNLFLPDFEGDPHSLQDMWSYVREIIRIDDADSEMLFISIESVLQNSSDMIDWPSIISKCAYYLICHHSSKIMSHQESVYYMKEDIDAVNFDAFWQAVLLSLNEENINSKKRKSNETENELFEKKRKCDLISEESFHSDEMNIPDLLLVPDITETTSNRVQDMLTSLQAALRKETEEEDGFIQKLNDSIVGESMFDESIVHEEKLVSQDSTVPQPHRDVEAKNIASGFSHPGASPKYLYSMQLEETSSSSNLWRKLIGKDLPSGVSSPSSISEKLADLRYNIQKNNILEDNLSLLLDL